MSIYDDMIEYGFSDEEECLEALEDNYSGCFGSIDYEDEEY